MRGRGESGFALLLVFVLAAAIAIGLYIEVPRIAFESQRAREQLFIDRGLEYKRAVQLFYRKYRSYPQTLDDLETKRNIRFLRHRYTDPLTGEDYRLLHVGPAGQLTDSLIQPANPFQPGQDGASNSAGANSTSASTATSPTLGPDGQPMEPVDPMNMAARRPSDRIMPTSGASSEPDQNPAYPGQTVIPGQPFLPQDPSQLPPQNTGQSEQITPYPGQSGAPGVQPNPVQYNPFPQNPAQPLQGAAGNPPQQQAMPQQSQAANLIQQILTTPRQPPASVAGLFGGIASGIVGVASNAEGKGIHVINGHSKYNEWELIYDIKKDKTAMGGIMFPQQPQQTNGAPGMNASPQSQATTAK